MHIHKKCNYLVFWESTVTGRSENVSSLLVGSPPLLFQWPQQSQHHAKCLQSLLSQARSPLAQRWACRWESGPGWAPAASQAPSLGSLLLDGDVWVAGGCPLEDEKPPPLAHRFYLLKPVLKNGHSIEPWVTESFQRCWNHSIIGPLENGIISSCKYTLSQKKIWIWEEMGTKDGLFRDTHVYQIKEENWGLEKYY